MREYFINADFDLSLRPRWQPQTADGKGRQATEMPYHMLLFGCDGDSVLVDTGPDEDFLAYLGRAGLPRLATRVLPSINSFAEFVPFGWNSRADVFNTSYRRPTAHPSLEVVRCVNGRRFAAEIEEELFGVSEVLGVFTAPDGIESCIASRPAHEEWLLKSEHGNAAIGNRRLRSPAFSRSDREVVHRLLSEDDCLLLERWRQRVLDIATVFSVDVDGSVGDIFAYEVVNTTDGAYIGSIFDNDSESLEDWLPEVTEIASKVGGRLYAAGYFGPVCLDHFVWSDGGERLLRPLADLNARLQVSAPILRLWRSWGGDRVVYWRLFTARKLGIPSDFSEIEAALGPESFNSENRCGVLVTSPLTVGGERLRKVGVLLSGTSRAEVEGMDRRFRERFER